MLLDASVTNSLVTFATNVVNDIGLAGVAALTLSSAVIGAPGTEATMLFAGFNVFKHTLTLPGVIAFGVLGDVVGAAIAYAIGYYGLYELLERKAGRLRLGPHGLERAHSWFERYGILTVFVSRLIPLIRAAFPYAAGVAKMPFGRFIALAFAGSVVWIGALGVVGRAVGSNWNSWRSHLDYVDYAALAVLVLLAAWVVLRILRGNRGPAAPA